MVGNGVCVSAGVVEGVLDRCPDGAILGPSDRKWVGEKEGSLSQATRARQFVQATGGVCIVGRRSVCSE